MEEMKVLCWFSQWNWEGAWEAGRYVERWLQNCAKTGLSQLYEP